MLQQNVDNIKQVGAHMTDDWIKNFGETIAKVAAGEVMSQIRLADKLRIFLEMGIWTIDPDEYRRYREFCFYREILACGFGEYLSSEEIDKAFYVFDMKNIANEKENTHPLPEGPEA